MIRAHFLELLLVLIPLISINTSIERPTFMVSLALLGILAAFRKIEFLVFLRAADNVLNKLLSDVKELKAKSKEDQSA